MKMKNHSLSRLIFFLGYVLWVFHKMWVDIAYLNAFEAKIGALKPPLHNVGFHHFLGPKNYKRPFEIVGLYNDVAWVPQTVTGRIIDINVMSWRPYNTMNSNGLNLSGLWINKVS